MSDHSLANVFYFLKYEVHNSQEQVMWMTTSTTVQYRSALLMHFEVKNLIFPLSMSSKVNQKIHASTYFSIKTN